MDTAQRLLLLHRTPTLNVLTLSASTVAENASGGTVIGSFVGKRAGSTMSVVSQSQANWFGVSGSNLTVAGTLDFETSTSPTVTVRESYPGVLVKDTQLTVTVTNVLEVTLTALSLDDLTIAEDQPTGTKVGTITGATAGSTVTLHAQSNANMFAKDGNDIEVGATALDFETVPAPTITLRETHADASNSPRDSVIVISVTDVSEGPVLGPELLTNGDFSSATGWLESVDWTISGGKGNGTGSIGGFSQSLTGSVGDTIRVAYTIDSISQGAVKLLVGSTAGTDRTTAGTYSEDIVSSVSLIFQLYNMSDDTDAVIDNASCKKLS